MTKKEARVLLANRYRTILQAYRHLLEPTFEVTGMVDGPGMLLESTETIKPDVAVLDLTMRGINDVNTIRQLRNRNPNLKVIVLSVYDKQTLVNEALATGVSGFVLKKTAAWDLIPAIRYALQSRTYVSLTVR
ncbi:MAG: response regulator transcription factor [Candidatus Binatia bacterium]